MSEHVFPFLRSIGEGSTYAHYMRDARFTIPTAALLAKVVDLIEHGVENPDIQRRDSLAQDHAGEDEKYTLMLANPPFAGSLDHENVAKDLPQGFDVEFFACALGACLRPGVTGVAACTRPRG